MKFLQFTLTIKPTQTFRLPKASILSTQHISVAAIFSNRERDVLANLLTMKIEIRDIFSVSSGKKIPFRRFAICFSRLGPVFLNERPADDETREKLKNRRIRTRS